ncbi:MAG: enoyl-CoA hydratase/isomerase family protein [Bacteriovoracaceae bacterium]
MQNLFNYTTLSTRLEKTTRTLFVTLNRPDWKNAFHLEMLFELESIFAWCTSRVEINSIIIDSTTNEFSSGLDLEQLPSLSAKQLDKINSKLQKIIFSMMQLPQTIIVDLGDGSQTLASEFALGADIRLCSKNAQISFNHCLYGLIPSAGGMSTLSSLVSPSYARSWVLSGNNISYEQLIHSGFITELYENDQRFAVINKYLQQIAKLAPVQRIQSKLGLFESLRSQIESGIVMDKKIAKASMVSEDWRSKKPESKDEQFMPAKSMAYAVKLSLIKTEENSSSKLEH